MNYEDERKALIDKLILSCSRSKGFLKNDAPTKNTQEWRMSINLSGIVLNDAIVKDQWSGVMNILDAVVGKWNEMPKEYKVIEGLRAKVNPEKKEPIQVVFYGRIEKTS